MFFSQRTRGFGVFFDPTKTTSGQRFFGELCRALSSDALPLEEVPAVVLFNVSAPWRLILRAKLKGQKVVLRVDGLYCDRLCSAFLASFRWPVRQILSLGLRTGLARDFLTFVANLLNQNYGGFSRILMADWIVYQSQYSHKVHQRYFPRKQSTIIVNGAIWHARERNWCAGHGERGSIRLVVIYDDWKPAKRMSDVVRFVQWANETRKVAVELSIIGYTGKTAVGSSGDMKEIIEGRPFIRTLPRFGSFSSELSDVLFECDIYLSFSYRDPCPNVVVEAMAHGLPVVGIGSGGIPDIVGRAGVLLPSDDFEDGFYAAHRYEHAFPPIDFAEVLKSIQLVMANYADYQAQVRERFKTQLGIEVVAERYATVLRHLDSTSQSGS